MYWFMWSCMSRECYGRAFCIRPRSFAQTTNGHSSYLRPIALPFTGRPSPRSMNTTASAGSLWSDATRSAHAPSLFFKNRSTFRKVP